MASRTDILDEQERLRTPFLGSLALHLSVTAAVLGAAWVEGRTPSVQWGSPTGGGFGSVAVNVVPRIALPTQSGAINPVASDTESKVPEPQTQAKSRARSEQQDEAAVPIPSRNAQRKTQAAAPPNKYRAAQKDAPNQVYSESGQRMVTPMIGMSGGGGIGVGTNSPFGTQFGYYTDLLKNKVAQHWRTYDIDSRIRTANPVIVTFTVERNGSVAVRSVRITQSSGISVLDLSAQRAILEAAPFAPLPQQFSRDSAEIEFWFELRR